MGNLSVHYATPVFQYKQNKSPQHTNDQGSDIFFNICSLSTVLFMTTENLFSITSATEH